jgi:hypothetical protein
LGFIENTNQTESKMKTLILATAIAALSFTAIAEDKPSDKAASCKKISELAARS